MEKNAENLKKRVVILRGKIITDCIFLERLIDNFLGWYFTEPTNNKFKEMIDLILSNERMTFEGKRQVFCYIVSAHYPEFIAEHPKLNKDLADIIAERNIVAHYFFDSMEKSIEVMDKQINFVKYKNIEELIPFDNARVEALENKIGVYILAIHSLLNSVA